MIMKITVGREDLQAGESSKDLMDNGEEGPIWVTTVTLNQEATLKRQKFGVLNSQEVVIR